MNVQAAVFGCKSEVRGPSVESRQVLIYLGDGGGFVWKNSRDEFERVRVPIFGHAWQLERVCEIGRCPCLRDFVQSLRQVLLVHADKALFVRQVPVREVGVSLFAERIVDFDSFRENSLGYVQDLAAVRPVAVF